MKIFSKNYKTFSFRPFWHFHCGAHNYVSIATDKIWAYSTNITLHKHIRIYACVAYTYVSYRNSESHTNKSVDCVEVVEFSAAGTWHSQRRHSLFDVHKCVGGVEAAPKCEITSNNTKKKTKNEVK